MPVEGEAPACDVLATVWTVSGIGDEPDNRESTETLLRKLYAKAKAELSPQGPFARITAVLDRALSSAGGRNGAKRCMPSREVVWRAGCKKSASPVR